MSVVGIARSAAEKALEELRPLCEELPQSVIDPISLEPLTEPMVTRCGHTFERESLIGMYNSERKFNQIGETIIHCPICRTESTIKYIYYDLAFEQTIQHLKLINKIWIISQNSINDSQDDKTITYAEKTLAYIRPLCKELPDSVIDPISLKPFFNPMVMRCGHTFSIESLKKIYLSNPKINILGNPSIECSICKIESSLTNRFYDQSFEETIDHLKKIQEVFNKYVIPK